MGPDYLVAGRYRLRSKLGGGGMGAVWLAHDRLLDREVAIKQIISTAGMTPEQAETLRANVINEGRSAAKLSHNHAIAIYDVVVDNGEPWLVMEYMPSRSLAKAIGMVEKLPPVEVAQIGAQVADALAGAHLAGIIHRDIKPGNVLIADRGRNVGWVKVSDFGIATAKGAEHNPDEQVIVGTLAFLAPELARGAAPSEASDVFSLGATLYTAIEGRPPWGMDGDLLEKVAMAQIEPPHTTGPVVDAVLQLLTPDPKRRPTMVAARDLLIDSVLGPDGSSTYILGTPVRSADGYVPAWAGRTSDGEPRRPLPQRHAPAPPKRAKDPVLPILVTIALLLAVVVAIVGIIAVAT